MNPQTVLYYGAGQPRPKAIALRAGQVTALFEPDTLFLRYVRLGDHEMLRSIYGAVRDQHWNTIAPRPEHLQIAVKESSFHVVFDAVCRHGNIDFIWKGEISGDTEGTIVFRFDGKAGSAFLSNRIGLCVLHPITECAGKPCTVEKADGSSEAGIFPRHIAPHQPFKNIRAITHEVVPGMRAEIRFEGEIFEMEDQRNWADASFKTYSTPLEIPYPKEMRPGMEVHQSVTMKLLGQQRKILPVVQGRPPQISISTTPVLAKPAIGLCCASHGQPFSAREVERLKRLRPAHLRVDLKLSESGFLDRLRQADEQARALGIALQAAIFLSENAEAELQNLVNEANRLKPKVALWIVLPADGKVTGENQVRLARQILASYDPNILIAAGTDDNFVEINRRRPSAEAAVLPCFSVNPQVHAFDNTTLVENLGAQAFTVESVQQFCSQAAVLSPITLRSRFNPDASLEAKAMPVQVDVRQMSLLGAGWTLSSLARLCVVGGIHSLTYYETTGWRGVMETEQGSPLPEQFHSTPGSVFPLYHVFAAAADFDRVSPAHSSHPLQVESLALLDAKGRRRILAANLIGEDQEVKIKTGTCQARIRQLDERNAETAALNPEVFWATEGMLQESAAGKISLQLPPFALAIVDII